MVVLSKIYTKTGDAGQTGLFSGTRIAKYDLRLHAYGTLDELNSHLGLLRDQIPAEWDAVRAELAQVQSDLFALGSHMANDLPEMVARLPHIDPAWIARLEAAIDRLLRRESWETITIKIVLRMLEAELLPAGSDAPLKPFKKYIGTAVDEAMARITEERKAAVSFALGQVVCRTCQARRLSGVESPGSHDSQPTRARPASTRVSGRTPRGLSE